MAPNDCRLHFGRDGAMSFPISTEKTRWPSVSYKTMKIQRNATAVNCPHQFPTKGLLDVHLILEVKITILYDEFLPE